MQEQEQTKVCTTFRMLFPLLKKKNILDLKIFSRVGKTTKKLQGTLIIIVSASVLLIF